MVGVLSRTRHPEPFGLGTTENPPILPVMRRFLLLVAGIACLAACKKDARVTGKPVASPELHLHAGQGFHEAISDNPTSVEVEVFDIVTAALCPKWGE